MDIFQGYNNTNTFICIAIKTDGSIVLWGLMRLDAELLAGNTVLVSKIGIVCPRRTSPHHSFNERVGPQFMMEFCSPSLFHFHCFDKF